MGQDKAVRLAGAAQSITERDTHGLSVATPLSAPSCEKRNDAQCRLCATRDAAVSMPVTEKGVPQQVAARSPGAPGVSWEQLNHLVRGRGFAGEQAGDVGAPAALRGGRARGGGCRRE